MIKFILASQSPRRQELLALLGIPFVTAPAYADETSVTIADPVLNVQQTAVLKADIISSTWVRDKNVHEILLAADTTVALDEQMLNKPVDVADARRMLLLMRNQQHEVLTGYVIRDLARGNEFVGVSRSVVTMRDYSDQAIAAYIATGNPMDKAGAYAIQDQYFHPVAQLEGCFLNVMGLPLCDLVLALNELGIEDRFEETAVQQAHQQYPCPTLPFLSS